MPITCNTNGTICMKFFSDTTHRSDTVIGFIIGSIACFVFVILIVLIMYILCCKRHVKNKQRNPVRLHSSSRNQVQSTDIDHHEEQQPELESRTPSNDQPPSYQEANGNANASLYKNT